MSSPRRSLLLPSLLLPAVLAGAGCVSADDIEGLHRQMTDIETQIQALERKSSSKEEVSKLNANVSQQTQQLLKSNADTGGHEFENKVNFSAASGNLWRDPFAAASLKNQLVGCESLLEQDERKRCKFWKFDRLLIRERMVRRKEHHQRLGAEILPIQILRLRLQQCGEVKLAG